MKYETFLGTLARYPTTVLGSVQNRLPYLVRGTRNEYFFDRHRSSFDSILYFYQSDGILKRPNTVPLDIFLAEVKFFAIPDADIDRYLEEEGYTKPKPNEVPKNRVQAAMWDWLEHPDSGKIARCVGCFSIFVIILSTFCFCMETIPEFSQQKNSTKSGVYYKYNPADQSISIDWKSVFFTLEAGCILWFTVEFVLRLVTCPNKKEFMTSCLNWVDMLAIAPFYINVALIESTSSFMSLTVLRVLRLFRVFRIFKLSRHSRGLRILGETMKASFRELCLLVFFLMIAIVLFSSVLYISATDTGNDFTSIPQAFWYSVVTMTTVGYGDVVPKGTLGKLVGSICAVAGVLVIALPVPVIVENFKFFYRQENRMALLAAGITDDGYPLGLPADNCSGSN